MVLDSQDEGRNYQRHQAFSATVYPCIVIVEYDSLLQVIRLWGSAPFPDSLLFPGHFS